MILYTFQLTCLLALGHCCANLKVRQMPESVHLKEGASVNFTCTITYNNTSSVDIAVEWLHNSSRISFKRHNISSGMQDFTDTLHLNSVHLDDRGLYFCNVSMVIPCMELGSGSGTCLTVEVLTYPASEPSFTVAWTSLSAAVLAVGIGCVIYSKRKENKRNALTTLESDHPVPATFDVVYAKLNIRNSNTCGENNSVAQYCHKPQTGKNTLDSECLGPVVVENVLYSTLKPKAPDL